MTENHTQRQKMLTFAGILLAMFLGSPWVGTRRA